MIGSNYITMVQNALWIRYAKRFIWWSHTILTHSLTICRAMHTHSFRDKTKIVCVPVYKQTTTRDKSPDELI